MTELWTDPRHIWIAFGVAALATLASAVVFTLINWLLIRRHESWEKERTDRTHLELMEAISESKKLPAQVLSVYGPVSRDVAELVKARDDHEKRLRSLEDWRISHGS